MTISILYDNINNLPISLLGAAPGAGAGEEPAGGDVRTPPGVAEQEGDVLDGHLGMGQW